MFEHFSIYARAKTTRLPRANLVATPKRIQLESWKKLEQDNAREVAKKA